MVSHRVTLCVNFHLANTVGNMQWLMHTLGDTGFSGFPYGTHVKCPILWHPGAGFDEAYLNPTPMRRFRRTNSFSSPRKKELARHSTTNSSAANQEALRNIQSGDFSSNVEIVEPHASNLGRSARSSHASVLNLVGMIR
ncbi:hypothetical protein MKX03_008524 [Papaver bracteatum]|nr:hypothetical protein MKX03_008524 [Papaver bracteatum]